ncbi:MAG: hypothetical protein AAB853_03220 [Patescibacteria group bacterium]
MTTTCAECSASFESTDADHDLLERVAPVFAGKKESIPLPTLCPECRWQRRLAWRNERTLYKRKCDLTGREMFSMHPIDAPFPVYYISDWLTDRWDATSYGRVFDFSRPFFEQFKKLCDSVPHFSLFVDPAMDQNSEYTNCSSEARNCYLITQAEKNEDCYYSRGINNCKDCCDSLRINHCELCFECINVSHSHRCLYCQDCDNCSDCFFCTDVRGCRHCFGCHGLVQKEYHIFNQPVSREEWTEKVRNLKLNDAVIAHMREQSEETRLKIPQRALHVVQCENSIGDHIQQCKNSRFAFDSKDLEECAYCYELLNGARFCMDFSMWGLRCELLYECNGCGYDVYRTLFSNHCWQGITDVLYCDSCFPSVKNCFGCFGLKRSQYCILNKQHTKEEYEALVPKIIAHMRETGEWGEFFPIGCSPFAYNEALSNEFFPRSREEVRSKGWRWREEDGSKVQGGNSDVQVCIVTGKPYKIIPQERRFYERLGLPLPQKSPAQRHRERLARKNPRRLWDRFCAKCEKSIRTSYAPERSEIVYCEECYLKAVY